MLFELPFAPCKARSSDKSTPRQRPSRGLDPANPVGRGDRLELALSQHVIHVCQHFAESKAGLVRIELEAEHERDQFGGRAWRGAAGLEDQRAAMPVMRNQFLG